jgi:hypothetical protein
MLIKPIICNRGVGTGWDNLTTTDWIMTGSTKLSDSLTTTVNLLKAKTNVVALGLENEPDVIGAYTYNSSQARDYMSLLFSTTMALTTLPLITKFGYYNLDVFALSVQNAIVPYTQIACMDMYYDTVAGFTDESDAFRTWYLTKNKPSQMWITEANYFEHVGDTFNATLLTESMVEEILAHNASVVMLFNTYSSLLPDANFFDSDGEPIANCETLMANLPTWQAAI